MSSKVYLQNSLSTEGLSWRLPADALFVLGDNTKPHTNNPEPDAEACTAVVPQLCAGGLFQRLGALFGCLYGGNPVIWGLRPTERRS